VAVFNAGVADDVEQRLESLEFLHISSHAVGDIAGRRLVGERFTEFVQRPTHVSQLLLDYVSTQLLKRTCTASEHSIVRVFITGQISSSLSLGLLTPNVQSGHAEIVGLHGIY